MENFKKYALAELQPVIDEATSDITANEFVVKYLSGVAKSLMTTPEVYRSFGAYWWALKSLLIEHKVLVFGDNLELPFVNDFSYELNEQTCCAAYITQQKQVLNNQLLSNEHMLETDDIEGYEYILHDQYMENLILYKTLKNAPNPA